MTEEKRLGIATRKMEGLVPSQISVKERRQTKVSKSGVSIKFEVGSSLRRVGNGIDGIV